MFWNGSVWLKCDPGRLTLARIGLHLFGLAWIGVDLFGEREFVRLHLLVVLIRSNCDPARISMVTKPVLAFDALDDLNLRF